MRKEWQGLHMFFRRRKQAARRKSRHAENERASNPTNRAQGPLCVQKAPKTKERKKTKMQVWFARLAAATTKRLDGMCRLFFPRGGHRRKRCRFLFVVEPRSFGQCTRFSKKAGGNPTLPGNAKKQSRRIKRATGRERKPNSSEGGRNRVAADTDAATIS